MIAVYAELAERMRGEASDLDRVVQQITAEELRTTLDEILPEVGGRLMGTIAEQLIEQGTRRGLEQGLQQGQREGQREGLRQGLLAGIRLGLKLRFGAEGTALLPEIYHIEDVALLQAVQDGIEVATTPEELRRIYRRTN